MCFKFVITSEYHHILVDIFPDNRIFFGFSWNWDGVVEFAIFSSMFCRLFLPRHHTYSQSLQDLWLRNVAVKGRPFWSPGKFMQMFYQILYQRQKNLCEYLVQLSFWKNTLEKINDREMRYFSGSNRIVYTDASQWDGIWLVIVFKQETLCLMMYLKNVIERWVPNGQN